jgi:hypothetical protein
MGRPYPAQPSGGAGESGEKGLRDAFSRLSASGAAGDDQLLRLYDSAAACDKDRIVMAVGDTIWHLGVRLLQDVVRDRTAPTDRRCAAVVALAKRIGADASGVLRECLQDDDESVRSYAIQGLAAVGDDGAWAEVLEILQAAIVEQVPIPPFGMPWETLSLQSTVLPMICYVGRHLGVPGRRERVTKLVRANWSHLYTSEGVGSTSSGPSATRTGPTEAPRTPIPGRCPHGPDNPFWRTSTQRAYAEQSSGSALVCGPGA